MPRPHLIIGLTCVCGQLLRRSFQPIERPDNKINYRIYVTFSLQCEQSIFFPVSLPDWFVIVNLGILSDSEHLLLLLTIPCTRRWLMCTIRPRKLSINRDFSSNISARIKLCRDDLGRHILLQRTAYCYIYNCRHQCWSS